MRQVKITVLKRAWYQDLADAYLENPHVGRCGQFEEGQSFLVTGENFERFPYEAHFCLSPWDIMKGKIYSVLQGGNFYWEGWMRDRDKIIISCDDGARPVSFLLEKVEG